MNAFKSFIFLAALCVLSLASFAQKGSSFIGVGGGLSLPTGNWGKTAEVVSVNGFANDPNGYAKKGGFFSVDGAWFFSRHFGVGGLFRYGTYGIKDLNSLSQGYEESFDVDQTSTTVTNYKVWSLMPGLYFNYPLVKKLAVTARALAGITHVTTPEISVDVEDGGIDDGTLQQLSASKTAFGFGGGLGLSYKVIKCLSVNLQADYLYSKPDIAITNTLRNNAAGRYVASYNEPMASVNFSLGVAYGFGHRK